MTRPVDGWYYRVVEHPRSVGEGEFRTLRMVRYLDGKPVESDRNLGFAATLSAADPVAEIAGQLAYVAQEVARSELLHVSDIGA